MALQRQYAIPQLHMGDGARVSSVIPSGFCTQAARLPRDDAVLMVGPSNFSTPGAAGMPTILVTGANRALGDGSGDRHQCAHDNANTYI